MMDKQQKQMKQKPNQETGYISGFLDEEEKVNESEFDEPIGEQEKDDYFAENQQNKLVLQLQISENGLLQNQKPLSRSEKRSFFIVICHFKQAIFYFATVVLDEEEQPKKIKKRPRKTIEQEIAELDAKRERLMEKKRRQDAHEKIVFGTTVIAMLRYMGETHDKNGPTICKIIKEFTYSEQPNNLEIINKIINSNIKIN